MTSFLRKIPIPFVGVVLGTVAFGNLLAPYGIAFRAIFGGLAAVMGLMMVLQILRYPRVLLELRDPVLASCSGTFLMAFFFLAADMQALLGWGVAAHALWWGALGLYACYTVWFSWYHLRRGRFALTSVTAGVFIVYVGFVAASDTAAALGMTAVGRGIFWLGLVTLLPTTALVLARYIRHWEVGRGEEPLFGIFAAPYCLVLVAYLTCFPGRQGALTGLLTAGTVIFYLLAFRYLPVIFDRKFFPAMACYTFPFVNSAIACRMLLSEAEGTSPLILTLLNDLQILLAIFLVGYVLWRYGRYLFAAS